MKNINLEKLKKYDDNGDDDSEDTYGQMLKEKIDKNDTISVKHENNSLKVKANNDIKDDNITFVNKWPLHPQDRLRQK